MSTKCSQQCNLEVSWNSVEDLALIQRSGQFLSLWGDESDFHTLNVLNLVIANVDKFEEPHVASFFLDTVDAYMCQIGWFVNEVDWPAEIQLIVEHCIVTFDRLLSLQTHHFIDSELGSRKRRYECNFLSFLVKMKRDTGVKEVDADVPSSHPELTCYVSF